MTPAAAQQPAGAFLMFSRQLWQDLGGFDERFCPVWFEDVDFCARALRSGYSGRYEPAAVARHTGGHSVGTLAFGIRKNYWYGNLLEYADKHFGFIAFRLVCAAVAVGALLRGAFSLKHGVHGAFQTYGAVAVSALRRLLRPRRRSVHSGALDNLNGGAGSRKHGR